MTDEQMRIAIAEACGWHEEKEPVGSFNATAWWHNNYRYPSNVMPVPDYCNDLNAMHEAENVVFRSYNLWQKFVFELIEISGGSGMSELDGLCCLAQSTARQRAEAFLRTLGKWEEA